MCVCFDFEYILLLNVYVCPGGVLRCCLDGGARLTPPNQYPSLRVILAEKGTHY